MKHWLQRRWYSHAPPPWPLRPLSLLYGRIAQSRRHRLQAENADALALPVIVVGNISVGGTGKTPFVIWLVEQLRDAGWRPGVISRGYGGRPPRYPLRVDAQTDAAVCGDEPLLVARRTRAPVMIDPDRRAAAQALIDSGEVDILIADDGLQHYRLSRQLEFCVVDGARGLGNGALLPAGPLREPATRLRQVDLVVVNGPGFDGGETSIRFDLITGDAVALGGDARRPLEAFRSRAVHAVAGIGHPERFFASLEAAGLVIHRHAFADHHRYRREDLDFGDGLPLIMTEKDAVKCTAFALPDAWSLPVTAHLAPAHEQRVRELCAHLRRPHGP